MGTINFYQYAKEAIKESINSLNDHVEVANFYGNPDQCTIECYFSNEIRNGKLYLYADCCEEELLIGEVDSLREEFEMARRDAFEEYLEGLAEHEDLHVREIAAGNPNTPAQYSVKCDF